MLYTQKETFHCYRLDERYKIQTSPNGADPKNPAEALGFWHIRRASLHVDFVFYQSIRESMDILHLVSISRDIHTICYTWLSWDLVMANAEVFL